MRQLKDRLACSRSKNIIANVTELAASQKVLLKKLRMLKVILLKAQSLLLKVKNAQSCFAQSRVIAQSHCSKNYVLKYIRKCRSTFLFMKIEYKRSQIRLTWSARHFTE
jgi:hypothetical protein